MTSAGASISHHWSKKQFPCCEPADLRKDEVTYTPGVHISLILQGGSLKTFLEDQYLKLGKVGCGRGGTQTHEGPIQQCLMAVLPPGYHIPDPPNSSPM